MKKKNSIALISSLIIWLPVGVDLLFWNKLPQKIPTHFNEQMVADSWSSKTPALIILPLTLTAAQFLLLFMIERDPRKDNFQDWITYVVLAIMPVLSIALNFITLSTALGDNSRINRQAPVNLLAGVMLIVLGIVLRYVKSNQTVGIRLPWTLSSPENWQMTHLLGSKAFICGGIVELVAAMFSYYLLLIPILLITVIVPAVYSYILHRKGI